MLKKQLDYESVQKYSLIVEAEDRGDPKLSSNLTINLEVQDVNDNPPIFEREAYYVSVSESIIVNSQFLQVGRNISCKFIKKRTNDEKLK